MESPRPATFTTELEKRTLLRVVHRHPEWSLHSLLKVVDNGGPVAATLGDVTVAELMNDPGALRLRLPDDDGPIIDLDRRARAKQANAEAFDNLMLEVLIEAQPRALAASYLTARLGGPRWKLQASLESPGGRGKSCASRGNERDARPRT